MDSRSNISRQARRSAAAFVFAVTGIACALVIAACGSSHHSSHNKASSYSTLIKYSDCMRSNGVSNFPDPEDGGYPLRTSGINQQSPGFVSALKACASVQPGGSKLAPITSAQLHQMAEKARCIREHGFPNFPDSTLNPGGYGIANDPGPGWSPRAPAAIAAEKACASVGSVTPGWGDEAPPGSS